MKARDDNSKYVRYVEFLDEDDGLIAEYRSEKKYHENASTKSYTIAADE